MKTKDRQFLLGMALTFVGYHFATTCDWDTESSFKIGLNVFIAIAYTGVMIYGINKVIKNTK